MAPKIIKSPENISILHGTSLSIPLTSNFTDDDGDAITMVATYSKNGGAAVAIPSGIFTVPSAFTINVASTSILDSGSYIITLKVSDQLPSSVSTSFTLSITNAAPRVISVPPSLTMKHATSLSIPLSSYFIDDDGDPITMEATYSLNGVAAVAIPGGIFSVPSPFTLDVTSNSIANTGVYTIRLTVKDQLPASVTQSFTINITNSVPKVVSIPPNKSLNHSQSISIPLASYFTDDDGDLITMTATYSFNRGAAVAIPSRIFTVPSPFTIDVKSTSIRDTGTYIITLTVKDALPS